MRDVTRRTVTEVQRVTNQTVTPKNTFTPAGRAFPNTGRITVDARYVGHREVTVFKKVFRGEFASLLIVLGVLFGGSSILFLAFLILGWSR